MSNKESVASTTIGRWVTGSNIDQGYEFKGDKVGIYQKNEKLFEMDYALFSTNELPQGVLKNVEASSTYMLFVNGETKEWYKVDKMTNAIIKLINPDNGIELILHK